MKLIQEIKVECESQQESDALLEWVENQTYCTVEFNILTPGATGPRRVVSMLPFDPEHSARFEEFCAELQHFVERA